MADPAGLDPDAHLSAARIGELSLDGFEVSAGAGDLEREGMDHATVTSQRAQLSLS